MPLEIKYQIEFRGPTDAKWYGQMNEDYRGKSPRYFDDLEKAKKEVFWNNQSDQQWDHFGVERRIVKVRILTLREVLDLKP